MNKYTIIIEGSNVMRIGTTMTYGIIGYIIHRIMSFMPFKSSCRIMSLMSYHVIMSLAALAAAPTP